MVVFFIEDAKRGQIIADYKDLANGDYTIQQLKKDILDTWRIKNGYNKKI